jgi:hypothetical protein
LIDIKISFSSISAIFFCRDAMNDDTTDSAIVLKMKLAIDAKNFLSRSRSRLIDAMNIIESRCSEVDSIDDSIDDSVDEIDNSSLI